MAKGIKGSTPTGENRPVKTSFIIDAVTMKKIRYIALMEETEITVVVDKSFQETIAKYEKKNGPIPIKN